MATSSTLAVLATATLFLIALAPSAEAASIRIASGAVQPGDHTLRVEVGDFRLAPVSGNPTNRAGEGHIHYLLNGKAAPGDYATPQTSFTFTGLKAGDEVGAELVNNDHTSLTPRVLAASKVATAGAPGFEGLAALAAVGVAILALRRRPA
jgi:MYXO-CTERM domain-containing protein